MDKLFLTWDGFRVRVGVRVLRMEQQTRMVESGQHLAGQSVTDMAWFHR